MLRSPTASRGLARLAAGALPCAALTVALGLGGSLIGGCGAPPRSQATPGWTGTAPPTATSTGTAPPTAPPGGLPTLPGGVPTQPGGLPTQPGGLPTMPGGLPGLPGGLPPAPTTATPSARECDGRPSATEVLTLVRRSKVIPADVRATADTGPLCASDWQFTQFTAPDHDPLQVVTRRRDSRLTMVAAGTDVCDDEVRSAAPDAIRALACDADTGQRGAA